jgi:hypothetical protein
LRPASAQLFRTSRRLQSAFSLRADFNPAIITGPQADLNLGLTTYVNGNLVDIRPREKVPPGRRPGLDTGGLLLPTRPFLTPINTICKVMCVGY